MTVEHEGYLIVTDEMNLKKIRQKGSGPVPEKLRGQFTTPQYAVRAIDVYLEETKKGKDNGKAVSAP